MNRVKVLILLLLTSGIGFSANAQAEELDLGLTQEQAKVLFDSLSKDSETTTAESYGAGIYGTRYRRYSGDNTFCDKIEYEYEELLQKYSCSVNLY